MTDQLKPEEAKALFVNTVLMLATSTMQQLGKIINPLTGKTEVALEGAQATIDMLMMLQAKTQGNLDKEEERLVRDTLATLQMNYFETAQSTPSPAAQPASEKPAGPTPEGGEPKGPKPDDHAPKYHKTYG